MQDLLNLVREMDESKRGDLLFISRSFTIEQTASLKEVKSEIKKTAKALKKEIDRTKRKLIPCSNSRGSTWRVGLIDIDGISYEFSLRAYSNRRDKKDFFLVQLGYYHQVQDNGIDV